MAILSWLGRFGGGAFVRRQGIQTPEAGNHPSRSPVSVTQDSALTLSATWACINLLAGTISSLPIRFYEVNDDGTFSENRKHPLSVMFRGKVNRYQTRVEFWQTMVAQDALHGNAFALIQKNGRGEIIGLLPLMSAQMEVTLKSEGGAVAYRYNNGTQSTVFDETQIWHLRGMGNGIIGYSPLSFGRNSIGIGLAAEGRMSKIFGNGAKPAGVLTTNEVLKDDQRARVKQNFKDMTEGTEDTLFVLEHGFDYKQISMSPKDIELLSSRSFQLKDVCRYFGVPSVLINDMDSTTTWGSGIQEIIEGFYKFTIRPYLERYEASINCFLLKPQERDKLTAEFDFNALLRADMEKRFRTYKEAITGGFMSPNEARKEEGFEPKAGGDALYMQQQMVDIEHLQDLHNSQAGKGKEVTK